MTDFSIIPEKDFFTDNGMTTEDYKNTEALTYFYFYYLCT